MYRTEGTEMSDKGRVVRMPLHRRLYAEFRKRQPTLAEVYDRARAGVEYDENDPIRDRLKALHVRCGERGERHLCALAKCRACHEPESPAGER
jgi:hypothetical protein